MQEACPGRVQEASGQSDPASALGDLQKVQDRMYRQVVWPSAIGSRREQGCSNYLGHHCLHRKEAKSGSTGYCSSMKRYTGVGTN